MLFLPKYHQLSESESELERCELECSENIPTAWNTRSRVVFLLHLFCYSALLSSLACLLVERRQKDLEKGGVPKNECLKAVNNYSPILDQVEITITPRRFNGTLLGMEDNIYLQPPSPAVDAAWGNLTADRFLHVSSSDLQKMGKDSSVSVHLPETLHYGSDAYVARIDVVHKLHCLNLLRKDINFEYYYGQRYPGMSFADVAEGHRMHTTHCLHLLLQTLLCDANTDLVPYIWVDTQDEPYPDFSIDRKCGSLDTVLDWAYGYRVAEGTFDTLRKPEGQKSVVELSPGMNGVLGLSPSEN